MREICPNVAEIARSSKKIRWLQDMEKLLALIPIVVAFMAEVSFSSGPQWVGQSQHNFGDSRLI